MRERRGLPNLKDQLSIRKAQMGLNPMADMALLTSVLLAGPFFTMISCIDLGQNRLSILNCEFWKTQEFQCL